MAIFAGHYWIFVFGLLGNIVSFMVFLAPIPTFYQIYKKKSCEGFQAIPYVVALFSATLWIYYALLKTNATLIITINAVGCVIETVYIVFFIIYASKKLRMQTMKLLVLLIVSGMGFVGVTYFLVKPSQRAMVVGWICLIFSLCVFVAPLGILRQVIRTKSVEHMPFLLSFFLTLSAVMWFFYGLLLKDINIAVPNVLGFTFGVIQMILYVIYKNKRIALDEKLSQIQKQSAILDMEEQKIPQVTDQIIEIVKLSTLLASEKIPANVCKNNGVQASSLHQNLPRACEVN